MGLITAIQNKTEQARAKERIRPLLESRMMRDILLEIGQRGTEKLDPQSVPLDQRPLASKRAAECGTAGLQQSVIREIVLDEASITLFAGSDEVPFLYGDYNYETIDDTDCLPAVAQYLVQHILLCPQAQRTQRDRKDPPGLYQAPPRGHPLRPPAHQKAKAILNPKHAPQFILNRGACFTFCRGEHCSPAGGVRQRKPSGSMTSIAPYSRRGGFHIRPGAVPLPQTARAGSARPYRARRLLTPLSPSPAPPPLCHPAWPRRGGRRRQPRSRRPASAYGPIWRRAAIAASASRSRRSAHRR